MNDEYYMKEALKEAEKALKEENWPIGCVIVIDDKIIAKDHNRNYTLESRLGHAEMNALKKVQKLLWYNKNLKPTIYTTYEPCPMCFGAIMLSGIKKVVCGIDLDNSGAMYLKENAPLLFKQDRYKIELVQGVLADECAKVFMESKFAKKLNDKGLLRKGYL